jgi:hypothetical protein
MIVRGRLVVIAAAVIAVAAAGCHKGGASRGGPVVVPGAAAGDVTEATGPVTAVRDGANRTLAVGDVVAGDDAIVTGDGGRVTIVLRHNQVAWSLGPGKREKVADSTAWGAPRPAVAGTATDEKSSAAGRHAEREAAGTSAAPEVEPVQGAAPTDGTAAAPPPREVDTRDDEDGDDGSSDRMALDEGKMGKTEGHAHRKGGSSHHAAPHGGKDALHDHGPPGGKGDKIITLDEVRVDQDVAPSASAIAHVVDEHKAELARCAGQLDKQVAGTHGTLVVAFTVSPAGAITEIALQGDAALAPIRACVRAVFTHLRFPAASGTWKATYPLNLAP